MSTFTDCTDNLVCSTLSGSNGVGVGLIPGMPNKIVVSGTGNYTGNFEITGALDVAGTIKANRNDSIAEGGEIQLARAADNVTKWVIDTNGSGDASDLRIFDNSSSMAVYIQSQTRNVGIGGTSSPSSKLYVDGTITIGTNNQVYQAGVLGYNDTNWGFLYRPPRTGSLGAHNFEAADGTDLLTITNAGNVGIGTTDPAFKLDVNGVHRNSGLVVDYGNYYGFNLYYSGGWKYAGNGYGVMWVSNNAGGIDLYTAGNNVGGAGSAASLSGPYTTFANDGNVGIGTTSPGQKLSVAGAVEVAQTNTQEYRFNGGSGRQWRAISTINGATNGNLVFQNTTDNYVANFTDALVLSSSGYVGIGTTDPEQKLQVGNETGQQIARIAGGDSGINGGSALYLGAGSGLDIYALGHYSAINGGAYNDTLTLYAAGGRPVYMQCGNVGIGTISPNYKLTVSGGLAGTATGVASFWTQGTAQGERSSLTLYSTFETTTDNTPRRTADVVAGFNGGAWSTEYLAFNVGNNGSSNDAQALTAEKVRIQNNGNVGIGTTSPTSKLHVVGGDSRINGVRIGAGNGDNSNNVCVGNDALGNSAASYNTAVGRGALSSSTAGFNTGIGGLAGNSISSGASNTSIGYTSLYNLTTGNNNTALGYNSLRYLISAANNTTSSNCTGVGYDARITADNQVQLGDSATTTYAYGAVQNRSDLRDKTDIEDTKLGLQFLKKLRPVDFRWDYREDYYEKNIEEIITIDDQGNETKSFVEKLLPIPKDGSKKRNRKHHGLIAQEVAGVMQEMQIDFAGFQDHKINGGLDVYTIGYQELIAPIIKSVQELSSENDYLKKKLEEKDKQLEEVLLRLLALENK